MEVNSIRREHMNTRIVLGMFVLPVLAALVFTASSAAALTPEEIIDKANLAYYYAGNDGTASAKMTIYDSQGRSRVREITMIRKDVKDGGEQKFYVYFHKPEDVSRMVFMVWKNVKGDDDRWLYVPAIDLVKRVASKDKRSSFAGSHFVYEDVSGRLPAADNHELLREDKLGASDVYVIKNTPKDPGSVEFSYFVVYVDKKNFIPIKGEYFDKAGKLYKVATVEEVRDIDGIPTVIKGKVEEPGGGYTTIEFSNVKYNVKVKDDIFTERSLRKPPREWIK